MKSSYHHGDLANSLVSATVSLLESHGSAKLSLRQVARAAGVSHGAPAHHFGDKSGLLTAVAIRGYTLLQEVLTNSQAPAGKPPEQRLLDAGYAYIQFALSHTAYFEVMFNPALTHSETPDYIAGASKTKSVLERCIRDFLTEQSAGLAVPERQIQSTLIALWSQVHGFATLWLAGNLGDPTDAGTRDMIIMDMLSSITPRPYQSNP